eukprot:gb/GECH01001221.1/.p1 GENE.gb/GECH01001221.1/~~gb/GECH01001221.1/.p1  ORF type:complete len:534 (+),score=178.51 gb/GECH01001221.1/:1-1602(+)
MDHSSSTPSVQQHRTSKDKYNIEDKRADSEEAANRSQRQVTESLAKVKRKKEDTIQEVTNIRVRGDHSENERRINEELNRDARLQKLRSEAKVSAKKLGSIAMKWEALYELDIPQDVHEELKKQQNACRKIIDSKDRLIDDFTRELQNKDEEYVKALRKHSEDINALIEGMHDQTEDLEKQYAQELEEIETAFEEEREALLEANNAELESLKEQRRNMETEKVDEREQKLKEYSDKLDHLRDEQMENFNEKKKQEDEKLHEFEQKLEMMRGKFQLNTEKVKYNYRVLMERVRENKDTSRHNKGKILRLQDQLSGITAKYSSTDKEYKNTNNELTEQYRRLTNQYEDLQAKFRHFEKLDSSQFTEVWDMNEKTILELADRAVKADKIITQQILGLNWSPPSMPEHPHAKHGSKKRHKDGEISMDDTTFTTSITTDSSRVRKEKAAFLRQKREEKYWEDLSSIIKTSRIKVWEALEKRLLEYKEVLEDRANLISETEDLRDQNNQLRALLRQYLGSSLNNELQVPPNLMIKREES